MTKDQIAAIRALLVDYVAAKASLASEFSGDMTGSCREIIKDAKERAMSLGIEWDDAYVPEYVRDLISQADEEDS